MDAAASAQLNVDPLSPGPVAQAVAVGRWARQQGCSETKRQLLLPAHLPQDTWQAGRLSLLQICCSSSKHSIQLHKPEPPLEGRQPRLSTRAAQHLPAQPVCTKQGLAEGATGKAG